MGTVVFRTGQKALAMEQCNALNCATIATIILQMKLRLEPVVTLERVEPVGTLERVEPVVTMERVERVLTSEQQRRLRRPRPRPQRRQLLHRRPLRSWLMRVTATTMTIRILVLVLCLHPPVL